MTAGLEAGLPRRARRPALVEVDYWTSQRLTAGALVALLADIEAGAYSVADLTRPDYARIRELCDRYADTDIGFVDAAVLALVERYDEPKLATLDRRHFGLLRPRHRDSIELLPAWGRGAGRLAPGGSFR